MLWHQKYKEQNENLKSVEKEMSLCFDNIQEANLAIKKLKQLVKEAREFDGMKRMIELIEDEVINLQKYIEENQNQVKEKESYLKNKERDIIETYQNFADIESMRDKLKKIEVKLEDHKL